MSKLINFAIATISSLLLNLAWCKVYEVCRAEKIYKKKGGARMKRLGLVALWCMVMSFELEAFPCYVTVVKDSCWLNYDVTIMVSNMVTQAVVTNVLIPKGQTWARQEFTCQPNQKFLYAASFQPIIWQNDAGKSYRGLRSWGLPVEFDSTSVAWELKLCYASDFSETPLPPQSEGHCQCDFTKVTPIQ